MIAIISNTTYGCGMTEQEIPGEHVSRHRNILLKMLLKVSAYYIVLFGAVAITAAINPGFVEQLQKVTGLDYRVVKIKTGVYEVAFAYSDDNEITDNLSQITAATGLQLPEG